MPAYDVVGKMGLPLVSRLPEEYGPPSISLNGPDGVYNMYDLQRQIGPRIRSNSIAPFTDVISWQKGRHFLKFDAEVDRRGVTFGQARAPRGAFSFDGTYTGSAMADFILGYIRSDSVNPAHTSTDLYNYWVALSANDDFKITPRLTLNFGLRWDYFQRYKQKDDQMVNIQLNGFVVGDTVTTKTSPFGRELMASDWNNVGPRFGFAWRPPVAGETVVRGGYGIYYTPQISNAIFAMAEGAQATAGAIAQRQHRRRAESLLQQPLRRRRHQRRAQLRRQQRPEHARQLRPAVESQRAAQTPRQRRARYGLRRQQGHQAGGDLRRSQPPDPAGGPAHARPCLAQCAPSQPALSAQRPCRQGHRQLHLSLLPGQGRTPHCRSGLVFLTAYTFSKSISGPSDIGGQVGGGNFIGAPQDVYYMRGDRSVSGFDVTQRFVQTVLYDLPFARNFHGFAKKALDGWQLSTIMTFQSGFPAPVTSNIDTTGTGISSRPDLVPGQRGDLPGDQRTWKLWFNTAAFAQVPFGRFGTSPRTDAVRLPGITNVDFSINKSLRFTETQIARIPLGVLQLPEELQSRSGDRRPEQPFRHLRRGRRRSPGHHDPCDPTRRETRLLSWNA